LPEYQKQTDKSVILAKIGDVNRRGVDFAKKKALADPPALACEKTSFMVRASATITEELNDVQNALKIFFFCSIFRYPFVFPPGRCQSRRPTAHSLRRA
jgi:hypothetical protein